ncbi:MAG: NUDIX hydrolase [Magnetococcales bacterium]|nr:NUDIX hydrolase [Magnetococcales bacterium]
MKELSACPELQPVELLHDNPWFSVYNRGGYFTTEAKEPPVVVLPVVDQRSVVLVRVLRPVLNAAMLELPSGGVHCQRETAVQGAARELAEETGIVVQDLARFRPLLPLAIAPNRVPGLISIFQVDLTNDEFERRLPHDQEIVSVHCFSLAELVAMIGSGEINTLLTIAVILRYFLTQLPSIPA